MRTIIITLSLLAFIFAGCEPDDVIDKGRLDPTAMILLKPAKGVQLRSTVKDLTALQIVEDGYLITFQSNYADNQYSDVAKEMSRGFNEDQKDFSIPALKMFGIDVINAQGEYLKDFTHGFSFFIENINGDTIATIPDAVLNIARPQIEAAYADSNYTEVYRIFNEAFTFLPIE